MRLEGDLEKLSFMFWCYCYVTLQLQNKHCKNQSVYELLYLYKLCHVTSNICNEFLKERLVVSAWTKGPVGNTNGPRVTIRKRELLHDNSPSNTLTIFVKFKSSIYKRTMFNEIHCKVWSHVTWHKFGNS